MVDHTSDVDVFLWTHEFDKKIKNRFLADKILPLVMQHGLVNDSYELRLWGWNCKCNVDIMLVTKHNNTDQWNGYHVSQRKFRFIFFLLVQLRSSFYLICFFIFIDKFCQQLKNYVLVTFWVVNSRFHVMQLNI